MNEITIATKIREAIKIDSIAEVVSLLRKHPEHLNRVDVFGTCLHIAAQYGASGVAEKLLELGADVDICAGAYRANALNTAASRGQVELVKMLLAAGSTMDVTDPVRNPLFGAITARNIEIIKMLMKSGINFRVKYTGKSMKNMDAYAFALERGENEIASLLKESE